jgi:hypothetical protein
VPMTVSNANGVLSLDEECHMEFEPGSATSDNGPQGTPNSAGPGQQGMSVAAWGVVVLALLYL